MQGRRVVVLAGAQCRTTFDEPPDVVEITIPARPEHFPDFGSGGNNTVVKLHGQHFSHLRKFSHGLPIQFARMISMALDREARRAGNQEASNPAAATTAITTT